jgi:adenine-specific DNA-methyltransferase
MSDYTEKASKIKGFEKKTMKSKPDLLELKNVKIKTDTKKALDFQFVEQLDKQIINDKSFPTHLIIESDNAEALQQIAATHSNCIDIIYIDPPYNTLNRDFLYRDHFKEVEKSHNTWLSFMETRLKLAHQLLHEEGAIFISIDDFELYHLKVLCDSIFGEENFVANFIRKCKSGAGHDSNKVAIEFDYMLCFAKNAKKLVFSQEEADIHDSKYRYTDKHLAHRGKYYLRDLDYKGSYSSSLDFEISCPDGSTIWPGGKLGKPNTWRWSKKQLEWGINNDYIVFKKKADKWKVYIKQYQFVDNKNKLRKRTIPHRAIIDFSNAKGSNEVYNILHHRLFTYPKPVGLVEFVLDLFSHKKEAIVLDFFAGSGTSLHACLNKNKMDGGKRQCILVNNNENQICESITYQRISKVIKGYTNPRGIKVDALAENNLQYFKNVGLNKGANSMDFHTVLQQIIKSKPD